MPTAVFFVCIMPSSAHVLYQERKRKMKKRILSLSLVFALLLGFLPMSAYAEEPASTDTAITVTSSVQKDGAFMKLPTELSVTADLSETYGLTTDETVTEPTVLDALVALHIAYYGDDFTAETASNYLSGSCWISLAFGLYNGFTFAVNDASPNDGVVSSWGSYTGYTADEAIISEGDVVNFYFYGENSSYADYLGLFDKDSVNVETEESFSVTLSGYSYMSAGCSPDLERLITPIADATLGTIDEDGSFTSLSITTDENGEASLSFDTAGTYLLSATGSVVTETYDWSSEAMVEVTAPLFLPIMEVTVVDLSYAGILATMEAAYSQTLTIAWENVGLKDIDFSEEEIDSAIASAITYFTAETINVSNVMKSIFTLTALEYDPSYITLADGTKLNAYDILNENASANSIYLAPYVLLALGDNATAAQKTSHIDFLCGEIVKDSNYTWGVDGAAIAIAALAPYYEEEAVKTAVDTALSLMEAKLAAGASAMNANTDAILILAYTMLGKDPSVAVYSDGVDIVTDMLNAKLSDGSGFGYTTNTTLNASATKQGMLALQALKAYELDSNSVNPFDLSDTAVNALDLSATDDSTGGSTGGAGSGGSTSVPDADSVTVKIYGVADDVEIGTAIYTTNSAVFTLWANETVEISSGDTAWDAVKSALEEENLAYINADGSYISSLNSLAELDRGSNSGWQYMVNGDYPDVGMNSMSLDDGDVIIAHYTDDYSKESDYEESTGSSGSSGGGSSITTDEEDTENTTETTITISDFTDINDDDWFAESVTFVLDAGLFNGTSDSDFSPNSPMTRNMFFTVLHRLSADTDFSDSDTWYGDGLAWAMEMGITDGTDMDGSLSRQQLATMLYRYAGSPEVEGSLESFGDSDAVADWAEMAMIWAVEMGIITGKTETSLASSDIATRAEVATMLMRFVEALS